MRHSSLRRGLFRSCRRSCAHRYGPQHRSLARRGRRHCLVDSLCCHRAHQRSECVEGNRRVANRPRLRVCCLVRLASCRNDGTESRYVAAARAACVCCPACRGSAGGNCALLFCRIPSGSCACTCGWDRMSPTTTAAWKKGPVQRSVLRAAIAVAVSGAAVKLLATCKEFVVAGIYGDPMRWTLFSSLSWFRICSSIFLRRR